jgi:hypothetical protein
VVTALEGEDQHVLFDFQALSGHEALEKIALLQPFDRQENSLGLDADEYGSAWVRLWGRQATGRWRVSHFTPLTTEHDRDGVRYDFSLRTHPHMLQVGGPQNRWRLFMLPVHRSVTVSIAPDHTRYGEVATVAVTGNDVAESILGYLKLGLTAHAEALWPMAEDLLLHKFRDPIGAAVGGYFLLRLRRFRRLRDWAANLTDSFGWLSDGAIIDGWLHLHLAREKGDTGEYMLARDRLLDAASRGLPLYTEGLRLLVDGLTLFTESAEVRNTLEEVRRYTDCVDWAATTVTFRGQGPDHPQIVPQLGMPNSTTGMVFLQNLSLNDIVQAGFLAPGTTVQLNGTDIEGVITSNGRLRLDTGQTYSDPDVAAAEILTTRTPQLRWHDWTIGESKTLATIADEARSTSQTRSSYPIIRLPIATHAIHTEPPQAVAAMTGPQLRDARKAVRDATSDAGAAMLLAMPAYHAAQVLADFPSHLAGELLQVIATAQPQTAILILQALAPSRAGRALDYLNSDTVASLLTEMAAPDEAAQILSYTNFRTVAAVIMTAPVGVSAQLIKAMQVKRAGAVLEYVNPVTVAALLRTLPEDLSAMLLREFSPSFRSRVILQR